MRRIIINSMAALTIAVGGAWLAANPAYSQKEADGGVCCATATCSCCGSSSAACGGTSCSCS